MWSIAGMYCVSWFDSTEDWRAYRGYKCVAVVAHWNAMTVLNHIQGHGCNQRRGKELDSVIAKR